MKIFWTVSVCALFLQLFVIDSFASVNNNPWQTALNLQNQSTANAHINTVTKSIAAQPRHKSTAHTQSKSPVTAKPAVTVKAKLAKPNTTRKSPIKITAKKSQPKPAAHLWNLKDVDILKVIAEVSRETGKNFIIDPQLSGKVTLVSTKPLSSKAIYQVFLSTLHVLGYAAVPTGDVIKIIPLRDAGRESGAVMTKHTIPGDGIVVQVIPVKYVSATQLVPILNPLIPTWANVSAVTTANSVIISGTAAVVDRVSKIIARVDTPAANGVDVVSLEYATAEDVSKELDKLIQASRAYGDTVNAAVSADDRSNSILLSGNQAARLRLKVLISQLDQTGSNGLGDTQVIHLHYIQVQDILPILRGIAHQNPGSVGSSSATPINTSSSTSSYGSSDSGNSIGSSDSGFTNQVQSITNAELNSGAVSGNGDKQQTVITGDVTNNALIITAPTAMMNKLKNVIARLDVRPEQVLVQGVIAEVDASKARNLGIQWGTKALASGDADSALGPTSQFAATGGMGIGFITDGDLRGVAQLLGSETGSNILSTPSITVLNNGHADIEVGKTFSELTGNYQPNGSDNSNPFQQFQDKSVGLTLRVTPQITGDDSIRLAIDQTNSSIITGSDNTNQSSSSSPNPSTNQEKISTSVLVNNGQILVLGGLINSQKEKVTTKVPFLGDIPLLGWAFKHTEDQNVKKDLLVFLRPVVITNPDQASEISKRRYEFMRDRQILNSNDMGQFTASSVLMSPGGMKLPVPFAKTQS